MKPRADLNEQHRVLTFAFNIPLSEKPLEIMRDSSRRRREKQLEDCSPKGYELIERLLEIEGVLKVNLSLYEAEVIFIEQYSPVTRRESITAIMKAVGGTLRVADEHVIVTTDAARETEVSPDVDSPTHED